MSTNNELPITQKHCQRCGTEFRCGTGGKQGGCWCMDLPIGLPIPAVGAGDCYCPVCLEQIKQHGIES